MIVKHSWERLVDALTYADINDEEMDSYRLVKNRT